MSKEQINELATDIYSLLRSDNMSRALASLLYGKGWRKQSEVAREIFEDIKGLYVTKVINNGKVLYDKTEKFMEVKKKYTEDGNE